MDDMLPRPKNDVVQSLTRQDLEPLSQLELQARIQILTAEIARTEAQIALAADVKAGAEALFRKPSAR
jgi:uncharacterized small protein (DUF1192 family)